MKSFFLFSTQLMRLLNTSLSTNVYCKRVKADHLVEYSDSNESSMDYLSDDADNDTELLISDDAINWLLAQ